MFGIVKPCRHQLSPSLHREWMGHLCGLCLTLREHHGQSSRLVTNTDAVVLSVLVAAQRRAGVSTEVAAPCVLRGLRTQVVVAPGDPAAVHAAAVSLAMAATKVEDHALDHDGFAGRAPVSAGRLSRRWAGQGGDLAALVGFEVACIEDAVARSNALEAACGHNGVLEPLLTYCAPTEDAAAAVFRHTAVLADRPENVAALDRIGRAFGRIVYVLDAADDAEEDVAAGRFNALAAHHPEAAARRAVAMDLFRQAHADLADAFSALLLERPALARAVLVDQVRQAGHRVLHVTHDAGCTAHHARPAAARAVQQVSVLPGRLTRSAVASARSSARGAAASGRSSAGSVAQVGLAALTAAGVGLAVFRPENPGEGPVDPTQFPGQVPGQYPGQQPGQPPYPGQQPQEQQQQPHGPDLEDATDCFCDSCACCACDCCCDGCDCGDCCDC